MVTVISRAIVAFGIAASAMPSTGVRQPPIPERQGTPSSKTHYISLRPTPSSEVTLREAGLTRGADRRRFTLSGPLVKGVPQSFFVFVNTSTERYHVIRLEDPEKDARKIVALYRSHGVGPDKMVESDVTERLRVDRARFLDEVAKYRAERAAPIPASVRSSPRLQSPESESDLELFDVEPSGATFDDSPQWSYLSGPNVECSGQGFARVQTWEPARFFFNVAHLNETWASAWWTRYPNQQRIVSGGNGNCWANESTFIGTQWHKTYCDTNHTNGSYYFDRTTVGEFMNINFGSNQDAVKVVASASVQFSNSMPFWGYSYEDHNYGTLNFFEDLLLAGIVSGYATEEPCVNPDATHECQQIGGTWNEEFQFCDYVSPLIVDVAHNGFHLTDASGGVLFDLDADGTAEQVAWTRAGSDEAFLAIDRNRNGRIDNGTELFGNRAPLPSGATARNGFEALKAFDFGSAGQAPDGVIDSDDASFGSMLLWTDRNHNGFSEPDELQTVASAGLIAIRTDYKVSNHRDSHGNLFRQRAKGIWSEIEDYIYDVWLRR